MRKIAILLLITCNLLSMAQNAPLRTFPDMVNKLGTRFPIENYKDKNGQNFSSDYLKGKKSLINLWFTRCPPCLKEIPILNELKGSLPNVNFMAITHDTSEKVNNFLAERNYTFYQITDAGKQLQSYLTIQRFPMSLILDKEGIIREVIGNVTEEKLPEIKQLLSE